MLDLAFERHRLVEWLQLAGHNNLIYGKLEI